MSRHAEKAAHSVAHSAPATGSEFVRSKLIRFGHCDPAGIVFYPQYLIMINEVIEDWFAETLKSNFVELHQTRHIAVPTVHFECDFARPSQFGDVVDFRLVVTDVGGSSLSLKVLAVCASEKRLTAAVVLVFMSLKTSRAIRIPDDIRLQIISQKLTENP